MKKVLSYIWGFIFEGLAMSFIAVVGAFVYVKVYLQDFIGKFKKKKKKN